MVGRKMDPSSRRPPNVSWVTLFGCWSWNDERASQTQVFLSYGSGGWRSQTMEPADCWQVATVLLCIYTWGEDTMASLPVH